MQDKEDYLTAPKMCIMHSKIYKNQRKYNQPAYATLTRHFTIFNVKKYRKSLIHLHYSMHYRI